MIFNAPLINQENNLATPLSYPCPRGAIASDQMACKTMKRSNRDSSCKSKPFKKRVIVWDATVPSMWTSQEPPKDSSPNHTFTLLNSYSDEYSKKEATIFNDALKASPKLKPIQTDLAFVVSSFDSFALKFLVNAVIARHLFSTFLKSKKGVAILSQEMTEAIDYYSKAISAFALASCIPPHLLQSVKSLLDDLLNITNKFIN
ncbi:hypothetical protein DSO57_1028738 [Entomophthora muscae]|uniref:Uncharacterized protein n=2 Tax=Entomophthora muscae TaxID=34485 RepID=A0ACC2RG22_9FUNG|nr:hypothetical protein DSO57_1028736 [Entomophthora muscae]KAJ9049038.1 hypothetical protein DSO57_1028738 [Entomophthora muscae]